MHQTHYQAFEHLLILLNRLLVLALSLVIAPQAVANMPQKFTAAFLAVIDG